MSKQTPNKITEKPQNIDPFALLSDTEWRFVTAMVENPTFSKKQAAEHIGITPDYMYRWGAHVDEAVILSRRNIHDAALSMRKKAVLKAIAVKVKLLDSEDENVRSKAASEIIEWELGKATQKNEHTGADGGAITTQNTSVVIEAKDAHDAGNILKQLAELGAIPPSPSEGHYDPDTE